MKLLALRAAGVVAAVYGTFLIFAQFAFVELLRAGGAGLVLERGALGAMAVAGILSGFWAAWRGPDPVRLRLALAVAAAAAATAPWAGGAVVMVILAAIAGSALGVATVTLSALLRGWCGVGWVGLGTGLGYACCNLPWVFSATPAVQSWVGAGFALTGALLVPPAADWQDAGPVRPLRWWPAVAMLAALVWLDSAAFFIIQHVAEMKAATWADAMCWRNAAVHLLGAMAAGWWLFRGGVRAVPLLGWMLLALAAVAVSGNGTRHLAGWIYPAGVSLYSTALVAWPAWYAGAGNPRAAAWRGAWLFAIAGWFASANGIGMAQTLSHIPVGLVLVSGAVVLWAVWWSRPGAWRMALGGGVVLAAVGVGGWLRPVPAVADPVARGHQIYLEEGCVHCHSQYLRPGPPDVELWGGPGSIANVRKGRPVLIGNRRQGPDLATVGARRSPAWLRGHFMAPDVLVPGSPMPRYADLFDDGRGDDLIAYLKAAAGSYGGLTVAVAADWQFPPGLGPADPAAGKKMFGQWCAACHGADGRGDGVFARRLQKPPANLVAGPLLWTRGPEDVELKTARVIKFGIPGTDMPGHEVLAGQQVADLAAYVLGLRK